MKTTIVIMVALPALAAIGISDWSVSSEGGSSVISPEDVLSVYCAFDQARRSIENGFQKGEESAWGENMYQAEKYLNRAEELMSKERAEFLMIKGWILFKRTGEYDGAGTTMLKEALKLDPENPRALYKVAFVELETYFARLPGYTKRPQRELKLPDGNVAHLEPIYLTYSLEQDNTKLEHARELLEKAVSIDPKMAVAYEMLGRIHGFKGDEPSVNYNVLFLKYRDSIDMELLFYNTKTRNQMIKNALQSVKLHAPEKLKELGLEEGYAPSPTPSPAS